MDTGLGLRLSGNIMECFDVDETGLLIPRPDHLDTAAMTDAIRSVLRGNEKVGQRIHSMYFNTDVTTSYRPSGSGPVVGPGVKIVGLPPKRGKQLLEKVLDHSGGSEIKEYLRQCKRREKRELSQQQLAMHLVDELPADTEQLKLLKEIEGDQIMTGGLYDNTDLFGITKAALKFIHTSQEDLDLSLDVKRAFMKAIAKMQKEFGPSIGVMEGSLKPSPYYEVRAAQETDGTICFPLYAKSSAPLDSEACLRIASWFGVDPSPMVGREVTDPVTKERRLPRVVDGICFALERSALSFTSRGSVVTTLARIQRHGFKMEDGQLVIKDGKARNVSPLDALSGAIEAMVFHPLNERMKEAKLSWMPSLQDYPTQVEMMRDWFKRVLEPVEYESLAADWSGYDKTVKGCFLASIYYYVVRPLYAPEWRIWVDASIHAMIFKYYILETDFCKLDQEYYPDMLGRRDVCQIPEFGFSVFGIYNGLCSGAKSTHTGGSLYGEAIIHLAVPYLLGWDPVYGMQAGDDTAMGVPRERIVLSSVEQTYLPIKEAAGKFGLDMNESKQIWQQALGQVATIFLQFTYHPKTDTWGIGSGARAYSGYYATERDKGLSLAEQYLAIISKFSPAISCPWIDKYIAAWMEQDDFILSLFHEYQDKAFDILIEGIGEDLQSVTDRLGLNYNWAVSASSLRDKNVPIIPIMSQVAASMSPKGTAKELLADLNVSEGLVSSEDNYEPDILSEDEDE